MDRRHGFGIFTCAADGYRYEGEWLLGLRHGRGTIVFPKGDRFSGTWREGLLEGPVDFQFNKNSPWAFPGL